MRLTIFLTFIHLAWGYTVTTYKKARTGLFTTQKVNCRMRQNNFLPNVINMALSAERKCFTVKSFSALLAFHWVKIFIYEISGGSYQDRSY